MGFIQSVRDKISQASEEVRERAKQREIERKANQAVDEIIRKKTSAIERQERIKQAERLTRERIKAQTDVKIKSFKSSDNSVQRGYNMLGFGAMGKSQVRSQPSFNAITGSYSSPAVNQVRMSKKKRRKQKMYSIPEVKPKRLNVISGMYE